MNNNIKPVIHMNVNNRFADQCANICHYNTMYDGLHYIPEGEYIDYSFKVHKNEQPVFSKWYDLSLHTFKKLRKKYALVV